jgi:hypothetical protein
VVECRVDNPFGRRGIYFDSKRIAADPDSRHLQTRPADAPVFHAVLHLCFVPDCMFEVDYAEIFASSEVRGPPDIDRGEKGRSVEKGRSLRGPFAFGIRERVAFSVASGRNVFVTLGVVLIGWVRMYCEAAVALTPRLAAILGLDMPAADSLGTVRIFRIGISAQACSAPVETEPSHADTRIN